MPHVMFLVASTAWKPDDAAGSRFRIRPSLSNSHRASSQRSQRMLAVAALAEEEEQPVPRPRAEPLSSATWEAGGLSSGEWKAGRLRAEETPSSVLSGNTFLTVPGLLQQELTGGKLSLPATPWLTP